MAYALQSMLKIREMREDRAQAELVGAKAVRAQAEQELLKCSDRRLQYDAEKEARRDRVYEAVIGRTVKMDDLDRARDAVTQIDEEGVLLMRAEHQAEDVFKQKDAAAEKARVLLAAATRNKEKITLHRQVWEEEDRRQREMLADAEMDEFAEIRRRGDNDDAD